MYAVSIFIHRFCACVRACVHACWDCPAAPILSPLSSPAVPVAGHGLRSEVVQTIIYKEPVSMGELIDIGMPAPGPPAAVPPPVAA